MALSVNIWYNKAMYKVAFARAYFGDPLLIAWLISPTGAIIQQIPTWDDTDKVPSDYRNFVEELKKKASKAFRSQWIAF